MATRLRGTADSAGSYLYIDYTITGQDIAGNYTDVYWIAGIHWGSYYFNIHDAQVKMTSSLGTISGISQTGLYNSGWPISGAGTNRDKLFWEGNTRVTHNSSGDGNLTFTGSSWWDSPSNYTSHLNATIGLPHIDRFSNPPSTPTLTGITSTSMVVSFTDGGGGAPIDSRQIGYNTDSSGPVTLVSSDGSDTVSGLTPGTMYYFWARTHNVAGYSAWSGWASAPTPRVPDAPNAPSVTEVTQISATAAFVANWDGGAVITAYQIGYGTSSSAPTSTISANPSGTSITGLLPATRYYFWARSQNSVGWSSWSPATTATMIAGAWITVGSVVKPAVPYVKVGGVWKLVRPWVRTAGVWKETS